jgi:hypothetical protein
MDDNLCPECGNPVPVTKFKQREYCTDTCRKKAWDKRNHDRRLQVAREYKARIKGHKAPAVILTADESWQRLIACTDENHRYRPASFDAWKREIGISK